MDPIILAIESSCDDTSVAISHGRRILANVTANQQIHAEFGGVVPELASRAHQQNIVPTVEAALKRAGIDRQALSAIAFTSGPGLLGSLLVGSSFAKSFALALEVPLLEVHHMEAHILAHLIEKEGQKNPDFPFLCLTVSGGHTQIVRVNGPLDMQILGATIDDAAGEAFDKAAKIMGIPYPGGPKIDLLARGGEPHKYHFTKPKIEGLDFSFSGLKTNFLYFLQKEMKADPHFIEREKAHLAASLQSTIVAILMEKLTAASHQEQIKRVAVAGGVSANSALRSALRDKEKQGAWETFLPDFEFCTDNAAMIAIAAYYRWQAQRFARLDQAVEARKTFGG